MNWLDNINKLNACLKSMAVTDRQGHAQCIKVAFKSLLERTLQLRASANTLYLIGNGASSSMASHVSADLAKNGKIHTQVFTDLSLITAIANDLSYEDVFSEPLGLYMQAGDMLVAISSSGNSKNILKAAKMAREKNGYIITLSAMSEDNSLRKLGDVNFYVPAATYGLAETSHNTILHYWIDLITGDAMIDQNEKIIFNTVDTVEI